MELRAVRAHVNMNVTVCTVTLQKGLHLIERWWRDLELWAVELLLVAHCTCYSARVWVVLQSVKMHSPLPDEADTQRMLC